MSVVLDSGNSEELSDFYQRFLGWEKQKHDDGEWIIVSGGKRDGTPALVFQQIDGYARPAWPAEPSAQQQMLHLDFYFEDVDEAVKHAMACGAALSDEQPGDFWRVMLDPAGHLFCIVRSRH